MAKRLFTGVLPSGVEIAVRNLTGGDQETLTASKNTRNGSGFNKMLAGAIERLGDLEGAAITERTIERMLSNDRKDALVMVRQHSLKFQEYFEFAYDWPIEGNRKQLQQFSVKFDDEDFARKPYFWVAEEMERLARQREAEGGTSEPLTGFAAFPIMYESYNEMLEAQSTQRYKLPESEQMIEWSLLTGEVEKKYTKVAMDDRTSNTTLMMRSPKEILTTDTDEPQAVLTGWSPARADILDVEGFRREIRRVEGHIDTILTIKNQADESRTARVDLVGTVDFFFPSQAI